MYIPKESNFIRVKILKYEGRPFLILADHKYFREKRLRNKREDFMWEKKGRINSNLENGPSVYR